MTIAETSMAPARKRRVTEKQFENWTWPEGLRAEWVEGEVIVMSPANEEHVTAVGWLQTLLSMYVAKNKLGRVDADFLVRLPGRRRLPDLFFVSAGNKAKYQKTYLEGAPDLMVEVVSPDSESRDWREKFLEYQEAGVKEYWIIDPGSQTVEFYTLKRGKYVLIEEKDGVLRSGVIPGFWILTAWLRQKPGPNVYELAKEIGIV
jgi:Uma2 family endonuclease